MKKIAFILNLKRSFQYFQVVYFDGHERDDVVEYRKEYCKWYFEIEKDSVHVDENFQPTNLDAKYLPIVQDETSKNSLDRQRYVS